MLPCADGAGTGGTVGASEVIWSQLARIFTVSPLHWLWTATAAAIAWRLWHRYGRRGTWGAVAALLGVMVIHSLNDSSVTATCDDTAAATLASWGRWALLVAMYLVFKAWARKSTPPQQAGRVSRGWLPRHLPSVPEAVDPAERAALLEIVPDRRSLP